MWCYWWYQAFDRSATGTSSGTFARKQKISEGPSWDSVDCHLLPLLCKLRGKRSSHPTNISISFEGKTHSTSKAIAQAFNMQFTACPSQHNQALRRLMRDLHHYHCLDPSHRPFDERGVSVSIKKVGSSTACNIINYCFDLVRILYSNYQGLYK